MLIKRSPDIKPSEITDESIYMNRRRFLAAAGIGTAGLIGGASALAAVMDAPGATGKKLQNISESTFSTNEQVNNWRDVTSYNNFYEFGTDLSLIHI